MFIVPTLPPRPTPIGLHRGKVVSVTMKIITQKQTKKQTTGTKTSQNKIQNVEFKGFVVIL